MLQAQAKGHSHPGQAVSLWSQTQEKKTVPSVLVKVSTTGNKDCSIEGLKPQKKARKNFKRLRLRQENDGRSQLGMAKIELNLQSLEWTFISTQSQRLSRLPLLSASCCDIHWRNKALTDLQ